MSERCKKYSDISDKKMENVRARPSNVRTNLTRRNIAVSGIFIQCPKCPNKIIINIKIE